jgi:hypothetical protein
MFTKNSKNKNESPAIKKVVAELKWKQFYKKLDEIKKNKFVRIGLVSLAIFIILSAGSLLYLNYESLQENYTASQDAKFKQLESALLEATDVFKDKPLKGIANLEKFGKLPKLLANRKNYLLSQFYDEIGETALAFISIYEVDKDYLPKHSAYKRAKLAERIGLEGTVIDELEFLTHHYPKEPQYLYDLAKSYTRQNLRKEAEKIFKQVQKNFPDSQEALGSEYYLANFTNDSEERNQRLINYLTKSPSGSLASLVAQQILSLPDQERAVFNPYRNYIALSFYYAKDYASSAAFFAPGMDKPDLYIKAFAESLIKLDKLVEATKLLIDFIPKIEDHKLAVELIDLLVALNNKETNLEILSLLSGNTPKAEDKILWEIAKRTREKLDYQKIYDLYPDSFYSAESMARVFWKEYERGSHHNALRIAKEHWSKYPDTNSHAFVAFWSAKIHLYHTEIIDDSQTIEATPDEETKVTEEQAIYSQESAREILHNLIIAHPRDYYSQRAQMILDAKNPEWYKLPKANDFFAVPSWKWPEIYDLKTIGTKFGRDIQELCTIKQYNFVLNLMDQNKIKTDKDFKMWLYAVSGDNLKAISTAYFAIPESQALDFQDVKFQYAYPLAYADIITDEVSKNLKIDPMLVHALIKQESRYQKNIMSKVGAVGLMQIMPYTAKAIAKSLNMRPPRIHDLYQPDTNIRLGVNYMESVFAQFDNNIIFAVASYNAGPTVVKLWKNKFETFRDADEFIESIPYEETRNYVKKVFNNYWIYKKLYS